MMHGVCSSRVMYFRTLKRTSTHAIFYKAEAMVPIKVLVPLARVSLASKLSGSSARICDEEALGER